MTKPPQRELVLVVDGDMDHVREIANNLFEINIDVVVAKSGAEAWQRCVALGPRIIITEVELPDMSGFDLCRRLAAEKRTSDIPLMFVTRRDQEVDRVVGFELGAADYVVKPVNYRELILRILRIAGHAHSDPCDAVMRVGRLSIDFQQSLATQDGVQKLFSPTEFQILAVLVRSKGRVLSRQEIIDRAWKRSRSVSMRTVDAHIKSMRSKLKQTGIKIVTIRGAGYCARASAVDTAVVKNAVNNSFLDADSSVYESHG